MSDQQPSTIPAARISPDEVSNREFSHARKGLAEGEVRDHLALVQVEFANALAREAQAEERIRELQVAGPAGSLTDEQVEAALGVEVVSVLRSARDAAVAIRVSATDDADAIREQAERDAASVREDADGYARTKIDETNAQAAEIRSEAEWVLSEATGKVEAERAAELERARAEGQTIVEEAREVRDRILADLAERQEVAEAEIARLEKGRTKLLEAYRVVQQTLQASGVSAPVGDVGAEG